MHLHRRQKPPLRQRRFTGTGRGAQDEHLCHPLREQQTLCYIGEALDSLPYIQRTSDIFFPRNWTYTLLRNCHSIEALEAVNNHLASNDSVTDLLRSKVLQAAWDLQRRNAP